MRILALETTDRIGSVAAMADDNPLAELMLDHSQRSAQSLLPAVHALLGQVGWLPADVQLVAVSVGPGSFTGLRVGVTAAKVFAYAVSAEVLGVNTLEAIAANCLDTQHNEVSVVIDAQRGEVVVQSFVRPADGCFQPAGPEDLLDADVWLARLQASVSPLPLGEGPGVRAEQGSGVGGQGSESRGTEEVVGKTSSTSRDPSRQPPPSPFPENPKSPNLQISKSPNQIIVTGPGLVRLLDCLPPSVVALDESFWRPRAAVVARLAARHYAQGRRDDLWKLVPRYYRRSAAEEKWDARTANP